MLAVSFTYLKNTQLRRSLGLYASPKISLVMNFRKTRQVATCLAGLASLFALSSAGWAQSTPPTLKTTLAAGVSVQVVTVRLRQKGVRVETELARGGIGKSEALGGISQRTGASVALTGTFFDTKTLLPIGDIVQDGELVHFGGRGAGLCFRAGKSGVRARIRPNAGQDRHTDWGASQSVLGGGMWLVRDGAVALNLQKQGFSPALIAPTQRVAVGLTEDGRLLLAATSAKVSLGQWAQALRALGAKDALNFDGGSSTGLYFQGKPVVQPGRRLTNALVVYYKSSVALGRRGKRPASRT